MNSVKIERVGAEIQRELAMLLNYGVKDPRLAESMISVSRVKITEDLKYAKIYVSILGPEKSETVLKVLRSGAGFMRSALSGKLRIRTVPELTFVLDDSFEYGMKIEKILKDLNISPASGEAPENKEDKEDKKD